MITDLVRIRDALHDDVFQASDVTNVFGANKGNALYDFHAAALLAGGQYYNDEDYSGRANKFLGMLHTHFFSPEEGGSPPPESRSPTPPAMPMPALSPILPIPAMPMPQIPEDTASLVALDLGGGDVSFNSAGDADELPSHYGAMSQMSGETTLPDAAALDTRATDPDFSPLLTPLTGHQPRRKRRRERSPSPMLSQSNVSHGPFVPVRPVQRRRTDPPGAVVVETDPRGDDLPDKSGDYMLIGIGLGVLALLWVVQQPRQAVTPAL